MYADPSGCFPNTTSETYDLFLSIFDFAIAFSLGAKAYGTFLDIKSSNWKPYTNKYTSELNSLGKSFENWGKVSKALAIIGIGISVLSDVKQDIDKGYSTGRIISNMAVNTAIYSATTFGIGFIGGKIGAVLGYLIPIPVVGNIIGGAIGTIVGYVLGNIMNSLLNRNIDNKSVIDYIRDGFYSIFK